jgi:hypothetical protein
MKIEHIAVWVRSGKIRTFYQKYFGAVSNENTPIPSEILNLTFSVLRMDAALKL